MLIRAILLLGLAMTGITSQAAVNKSGEELYRQHCAACHGYDGNGGVGVPLTLPDFQYSVTNNYLKTTIRHGRPGRVMPAFPSLSNADIKALIIHSPLGARQTLPLPGHAGAGGCQARSAALSTALHGLPWLARRGRQRNRPDFFTPPGFTHYCACTE